MFKVEKSLLAGKLSLRQGYMLALSLIFILASFKFAAMEVLVIRQDDAAAVINISGRQRMLSQRTALFTSVFASAETQQEREIARHELLKTVNEFEANHTDLIAGNEKRGLPILNNKEIYDVYYTRDPALDLLVKKYIQAVHIILDNNGQGEKVQTQFDYVYEIGPGILLDQLNTVVKLHEQKAQKDIHFILMLQAAFWVVTIIVLILEALLIFRPMVQKIEGNIAELKKREQKIKTQIEELKRFTHIASHDLQEPLRKIISFTERLEVAMQGRLDEKTQTYMRLISTGALHMRNLVKGLDTYTRILTVDDNSEEINAGKAVKLAIKALEGKVESQNVTINYTKLPIILYNKTMLVQVFEELVGNAIKYRKTEPLVVDIDAQDKADKWVFCVADNGRGIHEKFFDRIFTIFQRLHRKEDIAGIGLGLAMVRKIVERHGGEIWVESAEDAGARFYFTVPKGG